MGCAVGCGPIGRYDGGANTDPTLADDGSTSCGASTEWQAPVTVYDVAPAFGPTWWYIADEPVIDADPPPADPDPSDPAYVDPGTTDDSSDGSDASADDSASTEALHPKTWGSACFTCALTCTTASPDSMQPRALSASGTSAISRRAACADAERQLRDYAQSSYELALDACSYFP